MTQPWDSERTNLLQVALAGHNQPQSRCPIYGTDTEYNKNCKYGIIYHGGDKNGSYNRAWKIQKKQGEKSAQAVYSRTGEKKSIKALSGGRMQLYTRRTYGD